jgi:hypothetical protein
MQPTMTFTQWKRRLATMSGPKIEALLLMYLPDREDALAIAKRGDKTEIMRVLIDFGPIDPMSDFKPNRISDDLRALAKKKKAEQKDVK